MGTLRGACGCVVAGIAAWGFVAGLGACDGGLDPATLPTLAADTRDAGADGGEVVGGDAATADAPPEATETPDSGDAQDGELGPDTDTSAPIDLAVALGPSEARAGRVTRAAELIGGPKAEGLLGDFKLYNDRVAVVVEGLRRAGGYRYWGGSVIDVDTVHAGPGADRFGELWLAWNLCIFHPEDATIVSDGQGGGVAALRMTGRTVKHPWPESFLGDAAPDGADLAVVYDYSVAPASPYVELTVTLTNDTAQTQAIDLPFVLSNQGDGIRPYLEGVGLGSIGQAPEVPVIAAVGLDVSYAVEQDFELLSGFYGYQNFDVLQHHGFALAPGESRSYHLAYTASDDGTTGLAEAHAARVGGPRPGIIHGQLTRPALATEPPAHVVVHRVGHPEQVVGITPVRPDGSFRAAVPAGTWQITAWVEGLGASDASANVTTVNIAAGGDQTVDLAFAAPARIAVTVTDQSGEALPAQLTVVPDGATSATTMPPDNQSFGIAWGEGRAAVLFLPPAGGHLALLAGSYTVTASRGPTYELAVQHVTLAPGDTPSLAFQLEKSVDTTGWLAADMHVHGIWSSDSSVAYDTRARQAAANDLAVPVTSEHSYVGDLGPAIEALDLGAYLARMPAQEVTTFEYGHFNAYPLEVELDAPSHGAIYEHGYAGTGLFDAMHAQHPGDVVVQVNHPHSSGFQGYFGVTQYDAAHDVAGQPEHFTLNWDALEVFNGNCNPAHTGNGQALADWIAMNNHGHLKALSSGSDSHDEQSPVGEPRNWVEIELPAVALDPSAIIAPVRARHSFVSCGPFVRFRSEDGHGMGELGGVDAGGQARFAVEVQAPSWMQVESVALLENGVVVDVRDLSSARPDPTRKALRFDGVLAAHPVRDSWYAVEVRGSGTLAPIAYGDTPYALTNAIEIDADGDGQWTPPGM